RVKTKEKVWSVSRVFELNFGGASLLVAVWGTSSRLTQVTRVPGAIVSTCGLKEKLSIVTFRSAETAATVSRAQGGLPAVFRSWRRAAISNPVIDVVIVALRITNLRNGLNILFSL